jgi:hypothetical protein
MKANKTSKVLLIASALVGVTPAVAQQTPAPAIVKQATGVAPGKAVSTTSVEASATVAAINSAKREVTLKRSDGTQTTVAVSDEVRNFNQIKVGDTVRVQYTQALALELKKGVVDKGPPTVEQEAVRAPVGATPGAAVGQKVTAMAEVTAVDAKNHLVTVQGPKGNKVDLEIKDPAQLKNIKQGDHVQVTYVEAIAVSVEPTQAAAAK